MLSNIHMRKLVSAIVVMGGLVACSPETAVRDFTVSDPVRVGSGESPFPNICGRESNGVTYPEHSETDPRIAVNPDASGTISVAFMRDPTLAVSVATTLDGGKTWREVEPPMLSPCSMPDYNVFGDQDIDTDSAGRMYLSVARAKITPEKLNLMDYSFSMDGEVVVAVSDDDGSTWGAPVIVSPRGEYQHTTLIHAHKTAPGRATVFWHVNANYVPLEGVEGHLDDRVVYASTTDNGGESWSEPVAVANGMGALDVVEFPDGTLALECLCLQAGETEMTALKGATLVLSKDGGKTWGAPMLPALQSNTAFIPLTSGSLAGDMILAIDGQTMAVHDDGSVSRIASTYDPATGAAQVAVANSGDQGATWSDPVVISTSTGPAWNAALGRTGDGSLVAMWYDQRGLADTAFEYPAQVWVAVSTDGGMTWSEKRASPTMDHSQAPRPHGPLYFGNYFEIKPTGPQTAVLAYTAVSPHTTKGLSDLHFVTITVGGSGR